MLFILQPKCSPVKSLAQQQLLVGPKRKKEKLKGSSSTDNKSFVGSLFISHLKMA